MSAFGAQNRYYYGDTHRPIFRRHVVLQLLHGRIGQLVRHEPDGL